MTDWVPEHAAAGTSLRVTVATTPMEHPDMDAEAFRRTAYDLVDWLDRQIADPERHFALVAEGDAGMNLRSMFHDAPERGEPLDRILQDVDALLMPAMPHGGHPAYFGEGATGGDPGALLAQIIASALRGNPPSTGRTVAGVQLEAVVVRWLAALLGLPDTWEGAIPGDACATHVHALTAACDAAQRRERIVSTANASPPRAIYASEHADASIARAASRLALGGESLRLLPGDADNRMGPAELDAAIRRDRRAGVQPVAVIATAGARHTCAVDPIPSLAALCRAQGLWLHVDATHATAPAMLPDEGWLLEGAAQADSVTVRPGAALYVPLNAHVMLSPHVDIVRAAQRDDETHALTLWLLLRVTGSERMRARIREHVRIARLFGSWIDADPEFEVATRRPFTGVCFRAAPHGSDATRLDALNADLLARVNATGEVSLSSARLNGRDWLSLSIGHVRTTEAHVARAWDVIRDAYVGIVVDEYVSTATFALPG